MKTGWGILFTVCVSLWVGSAWTQEAKPLTVAPDGGFKFQGAWDCAGAFGNGKTHRSTYTGSIILGGKWLELGEQDIEPATGYLAKYLIGYDAQQKRMVEFDANNFGAATYSSTNGWQNGMLTMTSQVSEDAKAPYVANRFVYSISAPDGFTVDWQIEKTAASNWITSDHLVCKRADRA
jgi:hypothetical protein